MATVRAIFDGRVLVPEEMVDLPVGQVLELQVSCPEHIATKDVSIAALRRAVAEAPHLSADDLAEFEEAIELSKLPVAQDSPFEP